MCYVDLTLNDQLKVQITPFSHLITSHRIPLSPHISCSLFPSHILPLIPSSPFSSPLLLLLIQTSFPLLSLRYMAPELFNSDIFAIRNFADIFSLGITLYESCMPSNYMSLLALGKYPVNEDDYQVLTSSEGRVCSFRTFTFCVVISITIFCM